jgi:Flp pilus assembly protein TadG
MKRPDARGAAVVEFAVLLPLLLVLIFFIVEFGYLWLQSHYITQAAREGAAVASHYSAPLAQRNKIEAAVQSYLRGHYGAERCADCCAVGDFITVEIQTEDESRAVEVKVTVQIGEIWQPIFLVHLLELFEGPPREGIGSLQRQAVFPLRQGG